MALRPFSQTYPSMDKAILGVRFLFHHRQLHAEVTAPSQSWLLAPSVYTARGTNLPVWQD